MVNREVNACESGESKKVRKGLKKMNQNRVSPHKGMMISVENRPSSRKRPRLEFDPNGLDPFGLDVLFGLNKDHQVESSVSKGTINEDMDP
ncbi:hypothetical protein Hanom_Chr07g00629781 [Helianthus anomalus]